MLPLIITFQNILKQNKRTEMLHENVKVIVLWQKLHMVYTKKIQTVPNGKKNLRKHKNAKLNISAHPLFLSHSKSHGLIFSIKNTKKRNMAQYWSRKIKFKSTFLAIVLTYWFVSIFD